MFGRNVIGTIGTSVEASADGHPQAKIGGATIDWTTVAAVSGSDATPNDGVTVKVGDKYLRHGQVIVLITASGLYGPYDPAAVDGRQTLANGTAFIVNRTALASEPADQTPEAIYGGKVWLDRLIQSGVGAHSLAAGPTLAELLATFPTLHLVRGT